MLPNKYNINIGVYGQVVGVGGADDTALAFSYPTPLPPLRNHGLKACLTHAMPETSLLRAKMLSLFGQIAMDAFMPSSSALQIAETDA